MSELKLPKEYDALTGSVRASEFSLALGMHISNFHRAYNQGSIIPYTFKSRGVRHWSRKLMTLFVDGFLMHDPETGRWYDKRNMTCVYIPDFDPSGAAA